MTIDSTQVHLAPDGEVFIAPFGTTLPTNESSSLNAAFKGLGYCDANGVTITPSLTTNDIEAWQSALPVKTTLKSIALDVKMTLLQINKATTELYFYGNTWSAGNLNLPSNPSLAEYSVVVEWTDSEGNKNRFVVDRVVVSAQDALALTRNDAEKVGVTLKALDNSGNFADWFTDDAVLSS